MNFKANPPFNEMGQVPIFIGIATFKKETRMATRKWDYIRTFWGVTI